MILFCGCEMVADGRGNRQGALYQDAQYGTGNRVHTPKAKAEKADPKFRCTICLAERGKPGKTESPKERKARLKAEEETKAKGGGKNSDKKLAVSKS